ncbi:MAG: SDR family NAD(P)-dependent oxidoreductase [Bacteroidales bacterium]|nr:SDR family NAD(P)-dependent oxidoreductase [Bacteroidales bacterium]
MDKNLVDLVEISRYYGQNKDYVIAGGGNTSFKNERHIWVKASGIALSDIAAEGFAVLDRKMLKEIYTRQYSSDVVTREAEVKSDLCKALLPGINVRPSVETSLHEVIGYAYVVHTHPTLVNAITCSKNARETIRMLFGDNALFIPYTDPGYILFSKVRELLKIWRKEHRKDPGLIFLENHGLFVSADSVEGIRKLYDTVESKIREQIRELPAIESVDVPNDIIKILPALRMLFRGDQAKLVRIRNNSLVQHFIQDAESFSRVSLPFTPDQIVYCKARPLFLTEQEPEAIIHECIEKTDAYRKKYGYDPKMIGVKGYGLIAAGDTIQSVETMHEVFEDWMKISYMSESFGGPQYMTEQAIEFIDNWEVENYRRQVAGTVQETGRIGNRITVVTGGAQGFGAGIAEEMMEAGANVVIADLNVEKGIEMEEKLNRSAKKNQALFVSTNVTETASVENLIFETVKHFGGLDVFISNAGILRAGGLDEMEPDTFELMTRVNYTAYFLCAKYASEVLKLQSRYNTNYFSDIIQINSKSGLKGSKKNFAYAGGKFGGIGLTQSFALELMPFRIKVNSICPGNFFEGPLWSDPESGLFVQYLKAGKVPGAKNIDDVKAHYEKQVPAGRGCRISDVMKAIYYVIEQEYETGQAIPVTGGQEMLR